jgi:hypothetical protein
MGWEEALEAFSALGGTVILGGGAVVAILYARKADVGVAATVHPRPGGVVVVVNASIAARGVRPIRIETQEGHTPIIRVTEVLGDDSEEGDPLYDGDYWETNNAFAGESLVGGGESVSKVVLFPVTPPAGDLVGWRVDFYVDVPRFPKRWRYWWNWTADCFVEAPAGVQGTLTP